MRSNNLLTGDEIAAIEQRANAATPGPWSHDFNSIFRYVDDSWVFVPIANVLEPLYQPARLNRDFIAAAREDVPNLCRDWRALTDELAACRAAILDALAAERECVRVDGSTALPPVPDYCPVHMQNWPCRYQRLRACLSEPER